MPDPPKDAKGIFLAAVEIADAGERAAFVERSCDGDAVLKQRIEDLLRAYGQSSGPLDKLADALATTEMAEPLGERVGDVIAGRYKLLEALGEGGMGAVFMAQQTQPVKRVVALKLIKLGMDSKQVLARFEAERQALALMDHPNIAKVLDAGTTDSGRPFFVMELVKGVPITRFCDERQLSPRERLVLFIPVCQAIQHAHQKGVIHRDIKPTNVLIALYDDRPVPKVIDFGVAKATGQQLTDATLMTAFGGIVGTPEYMSPEQAQLNQLDIDTRSDVYALGVLLYELLTGTTPIDRKRLGQGALLEVLRIIREEEPPRPSTRLSTSDALASIAATRATEPSKLAKLMRGELDWIVMKCLEKDRSRRYETANGLAHDLARYLADEPVEAYPPSSTYRLRKLAGKYKKSLTTAAAFVLLLMAAAVTSTFLAVWATTAEREANRQRVASRAAEQEALDAKVAVESERNRAVEAESQAKANAQYAQVEARRADAEADAARGNLYVSDMRLAQQRWEHGDPCPADEILTKYIPAARRPDQRGWEWYYLHRLCHQELRTFRGHVNRDGELDVNTVVFSPDGQRAATAGNDETIRIWDVATGQQTKILRGHKWGVRLVAYHPNGKLLASAGRDATVRIWDVNTGVQDSVLNENAIALAFSSDGLLLGTIDASGEARLRKVSDNSITRSALTSGDDGARNIEVVSAAFSPHLDRVATALSNGMIRIWSMTERKVVLVGEANDASKLGNGLVFSPDGQWLATCVPGSPVVLWNASSNAPKSRLFDTRIDGPQSLAFSPDGTRLAVAEAKGIISLWHVPNGRRLRTFSGHLGSVNWVTFNRDGSRLASAGTDGTAKLWDNCDGNLRPSRQLSVRYTPIDVLPLGVEETLNAMKKDELDSFLQGFRVGVNFRGRTSFEVALEREIASGQGARVLSGTSVLSHQLRVSLNDNTIVSLEDDACDEFAQYRAAPNGYNELGTDFLRSRHHVMSWDRLTGLARESFPRPTPPGIEPKDIAIRPDGAIVLAGTRHEGQTLVLWDVLRGTKSSEPADRVLKQFTNSITEVLFSRDGTLVTARNNDGTIAAFETSTGREVWSAERLGQSQLVAFSPDARLLAACGPSEALVWKVSQRHAAPMFKQRVGSGVSQLAISPDNGVLAVASIADCNLWNLANGRHFQTLREPGQHVPVWGLWNKMTFTPDGKRLVSLFASQLRIRLWDAATGQEILALPNHSHLVNAVSISRDGFSLIAASQDGTVRIYDARPLTATIEIEQEARGLVQYLAQSANSASQLMTRVENYPGISAAVRQCVREWAPRFWNAEIYGRALNVFGPLSEKLLLKSEVIECLRNDKALTEEVRAAALNQVSRSVENAYTLNMGSWMIAVRSDAKLEEYQRTVRAAEAALRIDPDDFSYVSTLGVAQYRTGGYADAIATLTRSDEHFSKLKDSGPQPADLAFLAMAQQKLGHIKEAQTELQRLRERMKDSKWAQDDEAPGFLREAEALFAKPKTPAGKQSAATKP